MIYSRIKIISAAVLAAIAFETVAQDAPRDQEELEEILVTARRVEERIQEAPITVNAFTAAQIEDAGIIQTADFIQLTPNVTLAESQTMGTSFLTVRGLSRVRNGELPVAVVVDDVLIVNARQFISQVFDVRQIEVVKGPQGALYGRNATNGAVIITTNPPAAEPEGYVKMSYGTADEVGIEASYSAPLSENLAFRLSGRVLDRDGYFENVTLQDEVDPFSDRTLRGRLSWTPSSALFVDLKAQFSKHEGKGIGFHWPGAATIEAFGFPYVGTGAELGVTPEQVTREGANLVNLPYVANNPDRGFRDTSNVSLKIDREFGASTFKSVTTLDRLEASAVADRAPYLSHFDGTQHTYVDVDGWSQEFRLETELSDRLRAQAGVYFLSWERLRTTASGIDAGLGIKRPTTVPEFENSTNPTGTAPGNFLSFLEDSSAWAVFASLDYDLTDALTLSLAARQDEETREQNVNPYNTAGRVYTLQFNGVNQLYTAAACSGAPDDAPNANCGAYATFDELLNHTRPLSDTNEKTFSKFQPKITLGYQLSDEINFYGSWGVGYRAGQYNYPGISAFSLSKDVIDQEENSAFELGVKTQFGGLALNAAWFDSSVDNTQYFPFDGQAFVQVFEDIDAAELSGFEIEAIWRASGNLDLYAAYGTTDSEITAYAERPQTVGNDLPYVADGTFNAGAQFRVDAGNGLTFFSRVDYERRGEQYWTPENTYPRDSLSLVNLRFGLEGADWTLSAYVNNATDEIYNSEVVTPLFVHPAAPRIWRIDYRFNF